jgi:hypothetical protein
LLSIYGLDRDGISSFLSWGYFFEYKQNTPSCQPISQTQEKAPLAGGTMDPTWITLAPGTEDNYEFSYQVKKAAEG